MFSTTYVIQIQKYIVHIMLVHVCINLLLLWYIQCIYSLHPWAHSLGLVWSSIELQNGDVHMAMTTMQDQATTRKIFVLSDTPSLFLPTPMNSLHNLNQNVVHTDALHSK